MQEDPKDAILSSLRALSHSFFPILGISMVIAFVSYGVAKKIPGTYEVHFSYMVSMEQQAVPSGFQYDGFYALSSIDLFSATLASVASSPEIVFAAYREARLNLPTQDAIRLTRAITSEKAAPQLVRITVTDASKKNAEQLTQGLMTVLQKTIREYNAKSGSSLDFQGVSTEPWTSYSVALPLPIGTSLFMLAFLGGNMFVLVREALRRGSV